MARVRLPNAQSTWGAFMNGARIMGVTHASSGLPATGYTTENGAVALSYPLVADTEGGFGGWFAPGSYNITYNALDDTIDNPARWEAAVGVDTGTVALAFESPINVKHVDYGATGDGATDDTDAIQAALDVAAVDGGSVYLPPGTYKTTSSLTLGENTRLTGAGQVASTISYTGNAHAILFGSDSLSPNEELSLSDFGIVGTASGLGGVKVRGTTRWSIERLRVTEFTNGYGILLNGASFIGAIIGGRIINCAIGISAQKQAGDGGAGEGQAFNAIEISGQLEIQTCGYGIQIGSPTVTETAPVVGMGSEIHGITVEGCTSGGIWNVGANVVNVHDCYLEGNAGFHIRVGSTSGNTQTPVGCSVHNNFLYTGTSVIAVDLLRALHPRVRDNYIVADSASGNTGISIAANVTRASVWDNYVNGLATEHSDSGSGSDLKISTLALYRGPLESSEDIVSRLGDFGQVVLGRVTGSNQSGVALGSSQDVVIYRADANVAALAAGDCLEVAEQSAPSAPAANSVRIYAQDNGAGKTQLMALFSSGTAQQIAIQP